MTKFYQAKELKHCCICNADIEVGHLMTHNRSQAGQYAHSTCFIGRGEQFPPTEGQAKTEAKATVPTSGNGLEAMIAAAIMPQVEERLRPILDQLSGIDPAEIDAKVQEALNARLPQIVELRTPDKAVRVERAHKDFARLAERIGRRQNVWLWGPAGTGKSTAAKQIADALGLRYGYISLTPQTSDVKLTGFLDVNGIYRGTQLRDCYENGGVMVIEEVGNASGNVLTTLNVPLDNGHMAFPDRLVERHPDFIMIVCDNTCGRGATAQYNDRRKIDDSFRDRFKFMYWAIDEKLEREIALSINPSGKPWVDWVQSVRPYLAKHYPALLCSPRTTYGLVEDAKSNLFSAEEIVESNLFRGFDPEASTKVVRQFPLPEVN